MAGLRNFAENVITNAINNITVIIFHQQTLALTDARWILLAIIGCERRKSESSYSAILCRCIRCGPYAVNVDVHI